MLSLSKLKRVRLKPLLLILFIFVIFVFVINFQPHFAQAATTLNVTSNSGSTGGPNCTLRDAITAANTGSTTGGCSVGAGGNPYTIVLQAAGPYNFNQIDNSLGGGGDNALPGITGNIILNGNGNRVNSTGGSITPLRLLYVAATGKLTLNDLTVSGGSLNSGGGGAGIWNNGGNLTANDVTFSNNSSTYDSGGGGGGMGGGVFSSGTMTVTASTFSNNSSIDSFGGAGIYNTGILTVTASYFLNNSSTGQAAGSGGGIFNQGTLFLNTSTFSGNNVYALGGGVYNNGTLTLGNSTFTNNYSGIYGSAFANYSGGNASVNTSVFYNNKAGNPGTGSNAAIVNASVMTITNSTITGNTASGTGGGIFNDGGGNLTVVNSTIAANTATYGGGGIFNQNSTLKLKNTIVAQNSILNGNTAKDIFGAFVSQGYNLIQDRTGTSGFISTDLPAGTNPLLGSFSDNNGPTKTFPLLAGSPAIDVIAAGNCTVSIDQRGAARPFNTLCDIGAYEFGATAPTFSQTFSSNSNPANVSQTVTFTVSVSSNLNSPSGFVIFKKDNAFLGNVPISNGQAILTTSFPNRGIYSITASYSGDANFVGATSPTLYQIITNTQVTDVNSLIAALNNAQAGDVISFASNVTLLNLSAQLPALKAGVIIAAPCNSRVTLQNNLAGANFILNGGGATVQGLILNNLGLKTNTSGNLIRCTKIQR